MASVEIDVKSTYLKRFPALRENSGYLYLELDDLELEPF